MMMVLRKVAFDQHWPYRLYTVMMMTIKMAMTMMNMIIMVMV